MPKKPSNATNQNQVTRIISPIINDFDPHVIRQRKY
jgi:hypothetical protein